MNFTAYLDESGTHSGSDVIAVAGYISTPERWEAFETDWRGVLADHRIDHFHMTDFVARQEQFKGWSEGKRRDCFGRLLAVTNRYAIASIGMSVARKEYDGMFTREADAQVGGPYGLAATMNFLGLGRMLRLLGVYGWIAYVFESGAKGAGQVLQAFTWNEGNPKNKEWLRLLSLKFENRRQFAPLQAADILAYELAKQLPKQLGLNAAKPRAFALRTLAQIPADWGRTGGDNLKMWAEVAHLRAGLLKGDLQPKESAQGVNRATAFVDIAELQERWWWGVVFTGGADWRMLSKA